MTPREITLEAQKRGLWLKPAGEKLAVFPKGKCPPDFVEVLRQHKPELLTYLEAKAANLSPDLAPWLNVSRQIMDGEFQNADRSTVDALVIGLRSINHPVARNALERLRR